VRQGRDIEEVTAVAHRVCSRFDWQLLAHVGTGASKSTFKVVTPSGAVALKVFGTKRSERDQRELDAMTRCASPGVARILDFGTVDWRENSWLFCTEEFLGGGTLAQRVARMGPLDTDTIFSLGDALIDVLSKVAEEGLVHRDIKPDNIMFRDQSYEPVLTDFGLVRDLNMDSLTRTWFPIGPGTPYFASPEQLNNDKELIDWRSDQFSLAVTLSHVGGGPHPFGCDQAMALGAAGRREAHAPEFTKFCRELGLPVLAKMAQAWPIQRLRTPAQLMEAWAAQRR
jgi:serine/threonine protein kinase